VGAEEAQPESAQAAIAVTQRADSFDVMAMDENCRIRREDKDSE
jgi:hypothetical protein